MKEQTGRARNGKTLGAPFSSPLQLPLGAAPRSAYLALMVSPIRMALGYLAAGWLAGAATVAAQDPVVWTTNFYAVTGANFREIRQSIAQARPWKDSFDGDTRWEINWKFTAAQGAEGCACSSLAIATRITTTLPRWTPPPDVAPEVKSQWTRYFTNLAQHEAGHARLGLAAAGEVRKRISAVRAQPDCGQLKSLINDRANEAVAEYRRRELEYDQRTDHGRRPAAVQ